MVVLRMSVAPKYWTFGAYASLCVNSQWLAESNAKFKAKTRSQNNITILGAKHMHLQNIYPSSNSHINATLGNKTWE